MLEEIIIILLVVVIGLIVYFNFNNNSDKEDFNIQSIKDVQVEIKDKIIERDTLDLKSIEKAKELQPQLESMTEKMMETINDPSLQDSLQGLTDNLNISPPGLGLPNLGGGLDIGTSPLGGFDIGGALKVADVKLGEVGVNGFDSVLPDINIGRATGINGGAGAIGIEIPGGIPDSLTSGITDAFGSIDKVPTNLTEIGTGGLENPFKTFGNINIKELGKII